MHQITLIVLGFNLIAVAVALMIVRLSIKYAPGIGLMDHPNERSSHTKITPRGGGIGIVITWMIGCFAWWGYIEPHSFSVWEYTVYIASALSIAGVSMWDDFRSVGAGVRFGVHVSVSICVVMVFGAFRAIDVGWILHLGWPGLIVTIIWVVGLTNIFNFMDGIDGIAGLQGVVGGGAWAVVGIVTGAPSVAIIGSLLAGGSAGFLFCNWAPAKIFMGDVGSAFLGFCFGVLPLVALSELALGTNQAIITRLPVFSISVVWPFVADGAYTLCRRLLKRERVWKPHRTHLYQRMVAAHWNHAAVASYYGLWSGLCSLTGIYFLRGGNVYWVWCVWALFAAMTWTLTLYFEHRKMNCTLPLQTTVK